MKLILIIAIIIFNYKHLLSFGDWKNQLRDYDIIPKVKLRFSRSYNINRKVYINTKFSNFKIILKQSEDLFTNDFQSSTVDRYGRKTPIYSDRSQFFQGFVSGSTKSSVRAFIGTEDMISINIVTEKDIYQVESMSWYETSNSSLLIYRYSDMIGNNSRGPLCPTANLTLSTSNIPHVRRKRVADNSGYSDTSTARDSTKKFCTIRLVADYRFFREHGKGDERKTNNYLIELMDSINQLFKATEFVDSNRNKYTGYGFLIKDILIHTDWTEFSGHYNARREGVSDAWDVEKLLNSFGAENYNDVCLSHMFTYQSFSSGTLGLAWLGTWKHRDLGGICSSRIYDGYRGMKSVNTAWSTYKDSAGNHLISLSAYLVTAHELAHNWGSDHDPDSKECSPNTNAGGKYIMYTYSVVGFENNNRLFSPCSKRSIGKTISVRGEYCFQSSQEAAYCGNRRIESPEQCDVGNNVLDDHCCTEKCHLRPNMMCSPQNHDCCTYDCRMKPRGDVCSKADPNNPCLGDAVCDGVNRTCMPPKPLTGPKCSEQGKCINGKCTSFCETISLEACICDEISETCNICCRNSSSTSRKCRPAWALMSGNSGEYKLNNGRPCSQGVCENGFCKRKVNKLIERIWSIIDRIDTNGFAVFLMDNLVGTIIILSLVLWIPASIIVSCHDAKYRKLILAERNLRRHQNTPQAIL